MSVNSDRIRWFTTRASNPNKQENETYSDCQQVRDIYQQSPIANRRSEIEKRKELQRDREEQEKWEKQITVLNEQQIMNGKIRFSSDDFVAPKSIFSEQPNASVARVQGYQYFAHDCVLDYGSIGSKNLQDGWNNSVMESYKSKHQPVVQGVRSETPPDDIATLLTEKLSSLEIGDLYLYIGNLPTDVDAVYIQTILREAYVHIIRIETNLLLAIRAVSVRFDSEVDVAAVAANLKKTGMFDVRLLTKVQLERIVSTYARDNRINKSHYSSMLYLWNWPHPKESIKTVLGQWGEVLFANAVTNAQGVYFVGFCNTQDARAVHFQLNRCTTVTSEGAINMRLSPEAPGLIKSENSSFSNLGSAFQMSTEDKSETLHSLTGYDFNSERLLLGEDKRSTFMIRNIPNKYSAKMLLAFLDMTHYGTYDFFYLRMDFRNLCNMGYAFINFVDPRDAVTLAQRIVGKRWDRFNSKKTADLAFANIQGQASLIEKFRSSKVMEQEASLRPRLYYSHGPEKGKEKPFMTA